MKKWEKKTTVLGMAVILFLTGCGGSDSAPAKEEYAWEAPTETSETMPENAGYSSEMTDVSESEAAEESLIGAESAADMDSEAGAMADDMAPYADVENSPQNKYSQSGGVIEESKRMSPTDLYADKEEDYLGSCYDFDDEIGYYDGNEEYSKWQEKGFSSVMAQPLSTFSADVDTASYSNLRRLIREGYDLDSLPEGAVRIEEMLNYFSYDYDDPKGMEPFGVTTQISRCPWNEEAELLMIGLKTEDIDYSHAPASNLVFLLDVSGSMADADKLPLLQESFAQLTDNLSEKDRVSIVTYAAEDKVVLRGAHGNEKKKIKKALAGLEAGGGLYTMVRLDRETT